MAFYMDELLWTRFSLLHYSDQDQAIVIRIKKEDAPYYLATSPTRSCSCPQLCLLSQSSPEYVFANGYVSDGELFEKKAEFFIADGEYS